MTLVNRVFRPRHRAQLRRVLAMGTTAEVYRSTPTSRPRILGPDVMRAGHHLKAQQHPESYYGPITGDRGTDSKVRDGKIVTCSGHNGPEDHGAEKHFGHSRSAEKARSNF